ncbi:MAG: hypothetical protein KKA90_02670 [Nanoarchaeota archaeon]|nr:hypothetical protein [Nanoarchaeota archaeon]
MTEANDETITTTIEVKKELFLKFKAMCVLKELKLSAEIEKMIAREVEGYAKKDDFITA